jgi:hypothetical protein
MILYRQVVLPAVYGLAPKLARGQVAAGTQQLMLVQQQQQGHHRFDGIMCTGK